jgi:hypothetical protein
MDTTISCTLGNEDLHSQRDRWLALRAGFGIDRIETDSGLHLRFADDPAAEAELRELAAVERECCRWADWSVRHEDGALVLDVRSQGDGIAALHGMFTQA